MRPLVEQRYYEYDPYYDTRASSRYAWSHIGLVTGLILFVIGVVLIGLGAADMDYGIYNLNKAAAFNNNLIWTPNPFWPTYGKGFFSRPQKVHKLFTHIFK